jgi:hypothetical protein
MSKRVQFEARKSLLRLSAFFPQEAGDFSNGLRVLL